MAYYPFAVEKGAIYRLVGPDGSIAVFNEPTDPNYVGMITDIAGLESAEVRENAQDLVEADGGAHGAFYFARRPVVITASVFGHASIAERTLRIDRAKRASLALRGDSVLSWRPSSRAENMVWNPIMATDANGWGSPTGGWAVSRVTTGLPAPYTTGMQAAGTVASTAAAVYIGKSTTVPLTGAPAQMLEVRPGVSYTAAITGKITSLTSGAVSAMRLRVYWYKSDGTASSVLTNTIAQTASSPVTGTDYVLSGAVTAPSDAAYALLRPYLDTTNPTTLTSTWSGAGFAETANWQAGYQDGNTAGWFWQGDPHASASGNYIEMFTTLRRQQRYQESGGWVKEIQIPMVSEYATLFSVGQKSATGSPLTVDNRGNYTSYPILELTGASSGVNRITDNLGGDFRTTGLTLAAGEKVQFDMLNHTGVFTAGARLGQSANRYIDWANTKWVSLVGGPPSTTITNVSGGSTLRVLWRDVWA